MNVPIGVHTTPASIIGHMRAMLNWCRVCTISGKFRTVPRINSTGITSFGSRYEAMMGADVTTNPKPVAPWMSEAKSTVTAEPMTNGRSGMSG